MFAISATARAGYQILTKFAEAPLAYLLSAFAAVVYIVATVSLAKPGRTWFKVSVAAVLVELVGVLVVGRAERLRLRQLPARDRLVPVRPRLRLHSAAAADPGADLAVPPPSGAPARLTLFRPLGPRGLRDCPCLAGRRAPGAGPVPGTA